MAKFQFKLKAVEEFRTKKEQKMLEELSVSQRNYQQKINDKKILLAKKQ
jgi:hypothetical protein